tara:strand:- start:319 stop:486 length:168 start_codon:yes stop_codon:yes gene_type:complete
MSLTLHTVWHDLSDNCGVLSKKSVDVASDYSINGEPNCLFQVYQLDLLFRMILNK